MMRNLKLVGLVCVFFLFLTPDKEASNLVQNNPCGLVPPNILIACCVVVEYPCGKSA